MSYFLPCTVGTGLLAVSGLIAEGQTNRLALPSVADTALFEAFPDNSFGGSDSIPIGATRTQSRARGLFKFDIAGTVPAGARIVSATLSLSVLRESATIAPVNSNFDLHRLVQSWGEGTGTSNYGSPATNAEATWNARFYPAPAWTQPGAAASVDFLAQISSKVFVQGPARYTFPSTSNLVADVQFWLDHPTNNFGWIVISEAESSPGSARRFATRETITASQQPSFVVQFTVPPLITSVTLTNAVIQFAFSAHTNQSYTVEFEPVLGPPGNTNWTLLTNLIATTTNPVVTDSLTAAQRFYRVR